MSTDVYVRPDFTTKVRYNRGDQEERGEREERMVEIYESADTLRDQQPEGDVYARPDFTTKVRYNRGDQEERGEREERMVEIYESADTLRDQQPEGGSHTQTYLPAVQRSRNPFRAAAVSLGLLGLLLGTGIIVLSIYCTGQQESLKAPVTGPMCHAAITKGSGHKSGDSKRRQVRRSSRPTRPTSRYQASSNMVVEAVLKGMDSMKKKRRLSRNKGKIYSKAQRRETPPQRELSDQEDHYGEDDGEEDEEDEDEEEEEDVSADDDSGVGVSQNFNARRSRATSGLSVCVDTLLITDWIQTQSDAALTVAFSFCSESRRGSYRIGASRGTHRIWATRRPTKRAWARESGSSEGDDDSEDSEQSDGEIPDRCRPLNLQTEDAAGSRGGRRKAGAGLADIDPVLIDRAVCFDSVGGLSGHISSLKEMVVFPLLYPEVFDNFKIQPPRGCLFYGPPGTGKTLVARALANECSHGDRKVAFFMRKGADCLSKWVGESERQLRLLFHQAYQMCPSIIFFDEIDGLAPVRSSRQDQIHSSVVSTLLALMDGLEGRGGVVVIGATNRPDSVDPALRRPGRFDREFLFGLPDREARGEILKIHTRQWKPAPSEAFLDELAEKCVGYCGADIRAVCTEAALCALRRRYPQIYHTSRKLLLDVSSIAVASRDFVAAVRKTVPASRRAAASPAKALSPVVRPLLGAALSAVLDALRRLFPHAEWGLKRKREEDPTSRILDDDLMYGGDDSSISAPSSASKSGSFLHFAQSAVNHPTSHRPRMLLAGRPGAGQSSHLAPAVLHALESFSVHSLDSAVLFGVSSTSPEEGCAQVFREARRTSPSILYLPHIQQWWETAGPTLRTTFLSLLEDVPPFSPVLLLATSNVPHHQLDAEVQSLFRVQYGQVHPVSVPTQQERTRFFEELVLRQAAEAPACKKEAVPQAMEVLPLALPPPPRRLSERERRRLEEQEEDVLRELRLFLRNVTERLATDRRFKAFAKPVNIEEVPDYLAVVERPMDLSTLLSNIDRHRYVTVSQFLSDADLIWRNALEYNPDNAPGDRQIRHRACALKDAVHAIIRDELDEDFEKICEEIKESRFNRGCTSSRFGPSYYRTRPETEEADGERMNGSQGRETPPPGPRKKKRYKPPRKSKWSTGVIKKSKKKRPPNPASPSSSSSSSSVSKSAPEETGVLETAVANGCVGDSADQSSSSSSTSESVSDGDPDLHGVTGTQNGVQVNGFHRPEPSGPRPTNGIPTELDLRRRARTSKTTPAPKRMGNGVWSSKLGLYARGDSLSHTATVSQLHGGRVRETDSEIMSLLLLLPLPNKLLQAKASTLRGFAERRAASQADASCRRAAPELPAPGVWTEVTLISYQSRILKGTHSFTAQMLQSERPSLLISSLLFHLLLSSSSSSSSSSERHRRREARATKAELAQRQQVNMDKAMEILSEKTPPLVVNHDKLRELLRSVVSRSEGLEVNQLEKLYARLAQSIYRQRCSHDKTQLIQEMKTEIDNLF
ncbi:ATPase family AAA domain-containing protein 2-like [Centroberyx affinis]|uniref:ATPase family AAA domain-containing protein 2-like n=1 Tax=Centroberyx affinis TaxID=166261 RepID=UPI003A5BAD03